MGELGAASPVGKLLPGDRTPWKEVEKREFGNRRCNHARCDFLLVASTPEHSAEHPVEC